MIILPGYVFNEKIYEDNRKIVFRGYATKDQNPVVVKALKEETSPVEISMLMHEYEIVSKLDNEVTMEPLALEQAGAVFALVLNDVGAMSLREFIQKHPANLSTFLEIAIKITEILGRLHQKGIIHRNLKPENILIHPITRKVYIMDFSCAICSSSEIKNPLMANTPQSPEYMSPEQSAHHNKETDHRSDLYSLGVIFYEMMTGQLPYKAENLTEWRYAHVAQKPLPPDRINSNIHTVISDIIMKLLAKSTNERYLSAYSLLSDLEECKRLLTETNRIELFSIGKADTFARFELSHKFYGRDKEKKTLIDAYKRAFEGRTETILVSGYPGVGKTMLINECLKSTAQDKGFFITGKFDQLVKNIPYAPFATAFGGLIKQLMIKSYRDLENWKRNIQYALGRNGAVATEVIPELELIIGKQPPVDTLSPKEAENRFLLVFRDFVSVFAQKGHPLVLFLDDLQWADPACIHLLDYLTGDANLKSLLFIGAFRDNEINGDHPLMVMLEEANKKPEVVHIPLMPMGLEHISSMVAETLHTDPENIMGLSQEMYRKSGGNPFFLGQLLSLIYKEKFLYFDTQKLCWKWELDAIQKLQPGEDVLELLLKKLLTLKEETVAVMKLAACIGNRFDLDILSAAFGKSMDITASYIMPSIHEGLVLIINQETNLLSNNSDTKPAVFEFLHDRVQQAAYSLIPEDEKKEKHVAIGRLLLQKTLNSNLEEKILIIMDHFNRSLELIHDPAERTKLAELNLMAGRKAKASAAYASALKYFRSARALLPDNSWANAYALSFNLYMELAQTEYLTANIKTAEVLFDTILENAISELERAGVYGLKVILYAGVGRFTEAVHTCICALENLGVKIPLHPTKLNYARELLLFKWYMRNKKIEDLIYLPELTDPVQRKIAELLTRLCSVSILSYPDLYGYIILKTGNYAARNGNSEITSVGYFGYSITVGSILGNYQKGYRYGQVCIRLAEKYGLSSTKCIIYFVIGAFISHWIKHASTSLEYLKKAAVSGVDAGDMLIIGYAHCLLIETRYLIGISLEEIAQEISKKREIASRLKHDSLAINIEIYNKLINILQDQEAFSLASSISEFQQNGLLELAQSDQASLATFYLCKAQLCYLAGNYKEALCTIQKIEPIDGAILGFMTSAEYKFYYSLAITALLSELPFKDGKPLWKILKKNQHQMKKWFKCSKTNYEHKYLLIAAETARLQNRKEAMSLYDQAIHSARENGYIQNEALANELAARFYLAQGLTTVARAYMVDACRVYNKWGAYAKVKDLKNRHSELLNEVVLEKQKESMPEVFENILSNLAKSQSGTESSMEKYFIDKIIENISKETDLNKMLESFLNIAVKSIGADRAYLILKKEGQLFIEAIKDSNVSTPVIKKIPLEDTNNLSKSIVRYVARTFQTIVLNSGDQTGIFDNDSYITESKPGSIACFPLMVQGVPFGVIYFENSFLPGVFVTEQVETLKLLSAQIAYVINYHSYPEKDRDVFQNKDNFYLIEPLTDRELEVLNLISEGMSNKEIASNLGITINTVKSYIKNIYEKLGVNKRVQVVTKAKQLRILK
jgi:histidine kinase